MTHQRLLRGLHLAGFRRRCSSLLDGFGRVLRGRLAAAFFALLVCQRDPLVPHLLAAVVPIVRAILQLLL